MGNSLIMKCPYCKQKVEQSVKITDPSCYYRPIFRTFCGQDFLYRQRERCCSCCNRSFETVEMLGDYFNMIENKLQELENQKYRANYCEFYYEQETKKTKNLQEEVDSLKQNIIDLEEKYKKLANYVEAAPIEHNSSSEEDEIYVKNEEKDGDHLSE